MRKQCKVTLYVHSAVLRLFVADTPFYLFAAKLQSHACSTLGIVLTSTVKEQSDSVSVIYLLELMGTHQ